MTDFAPALPHDDPIEVAPDVFVVRGRFDMAPMLRVTRNMVVLRDGRDLTVVNSVRLGDEGEAWLAGLGTVRHVIRIGLMHGIDDPWYARHHGATYWAMPGHGPRDGVAPDQEYTDETDLPVPGLRAFVFRDARKPEAAMLFEPQGVLVACDSVQNWTDLSGCSAAAKAAVKMGGFRHPASPGPPWLKLMEDRNGPTLKADFERLAALPFRHIVPGHGAVIRDRGPEAIRTTIARLWG